MSGMRYTEEFKREAVAQITDRGHSVKSVADRLGGCTKSIYDWVKRYGSQEPERRIVDDGRAENRRLKAELVRVTEERDILKRPPRTLSASAGEVRFHQSASSNFFSTIHVQGFEYSSKRVLCLGRVPILPQSQAEQTFDGSDQTVLVGEWLCLWLSQGSSRPAWFG